jgi:hypothetical protein
MAWRRTQAALPRVDPRRIRMPGCRPKRIESICGEVGPRRRSITSEYRGGDGEGNRICRAGYFELGAE